MEIDDVIDPDDFARTSAFETLAAGACAERRSPRPTALFSAHGHVLITIARDPSARLPQIAERVDLSEQHVRRIIADLVCSRMVSAHRIGKHWHYTVTAVANRCTDHRAPLGPAAVERLYGVSPA